MPHSVPLGSTKDPVELLKESGLRVTPQRIAILAYMNTHHTHATADEMYLALKQTSPSLSVATVYNTLRSFFEAGLIRELRFGDQASRFDLNMTPHHHLICEHCGTMVDVYLPAVPVGEVAREHGFRVDSYHIEIRGLCQICQEASCPEL